jgi:hypothetical protein
MTINTFPCALTGDMPNAPSLSRLINTTEHEFASSIARFRAARVSKRCAKRSVTVAAHHHLPARVSKRQAGRRLGPIPAIMTVSRKRNLFMARNAGLMFVIGCLILGHAYAQTTEKSSARSMYFAGLDEGAGSSGASPKSVKETKTYTAPRPPQVRKPAVVERRESPSGVMRTVAQTSSAPLGLKYSVLKVTGPDTVEVSPATRFRSGDRIRLKIEVNSNGYLYVVHQGTSGNWTPMFPASKEDGSNKVEAGKEYLVPSASMMRFSGDPGVEKLFVVLSREPEAGLDDLIYALRERTDPDPKAQPRHPEATTVLAQNMVISDPLIGRLRTSHSRDLVLESVEDETPAKPEHAVYVVNPTGKATSRVVADILLSHQ